MHVRTLSTQEHRAFLHSLRTSSFLQWPSWGEVKVDWRAESIGWVKVGSGGHVAAYLGEWSYPLDEQLYEIFEEYLEGYSAGCVEV